MGRRAWAAMAAALCVAQGAASETPAPDRPKIGVALAGGSALGFAHVGVIEWLEEHRIPIDAVAGTSMGGLVGGLFATGADAAAMKRFVAEINWDTALEPETPFRHLAFRRKEDRREYPNRLEFGMREGKLRLPSGLSPAHGIGLVLSRIAGPYGALRSFDDLPTPFRCLAADLVKSEEVVFDRGDLGEALRATMSLPAVFPPVELDGKVLVDGGVLNNLPVDVARAMGSQIVIAVALHAVLPPKAKGYSLLDVAGRSIDVVIRASELRAMANADIVLIPDLAGFTSTDFGRAAELMRRGYEAAARKANLLSRYSVGEQAWEEHRRARRARTRDRGFDPQFVKVTGLTRPLKRNLAERMRPALAGSRSMDRVDEELTRITGLGRWESADYRLIEENGRQGLLIRAREKQHGPPFFNSAILIEGGTSQVLRFGAGGRMTFLDVGNPGSEWRTDFLAGSRDLLSTEYFHRVRSSKFFVAPRVFLDHSSRDIFQGNERVARFRTREMGAAADIGYAAGRFSEFRFGYQLRRFDNEVSIGLPSLPAVRGTVRAVRARWAYEGQDSAVVATRGVRASAAAHWVFRSPGAQRNYPVLESEVRWAYPLHDHYVISGQLAGGATISQDNLYSPFTLGGPFRLAALSPQQLSGNHYYFGDVSLLRLLTRNPFRLYGALTYEAGRAFGAGERRRPFSDGALGLIGETPIGVISFGGAFGEQGQRKMYIRVGRYF